MKNLSRQIYYSLFGIFAISNFITTIDPKSFVYIFYHLLIVFDPIYALSYVYAILRTILTASSLIPLYSYLFKSIDILSPLFWRYMLYLRIILELQGHAYEQVFFKSMSHENPLFVISFGILLALLLLPSYIAHFHYAFRKN